MIGRAKEIAELTELYESSDAQLIAIYGRRRIGKTYLVEQTFKNNFAFKHAGLSPVEQGKNGMLEAQLKHFYNSMRTYGLSAEPCPTNWLDAFFLLQQLLEKKDDGNRQVVFIDELPWLDTARSGFITAFEGFWNNWGSGRDNLMVIVCGSANSWMLDKLINNHGGLYDRVTYEIKLYPFTLGECEELFARNKVKLSRYDIAQSYMAVGGVPYYLNYFRKNLSASQNIDELFFKDGAKLRFEYDRLFNSVFANPDKVKSVVEFLHTKNAGYTRKEITEGLGISDGGTITSCLNALIASDFIVKYVPFGLNKKQEHYRLIDPFCIFYLRFVQSNQGHNEEFWTQNVKSQSVISWRGIAFENLCFNHIRQIKAALGISGVTTRQSAWSKRRDDSNGTQIDMLIERNDNIINMCEMKFYSDDYNVNKEYYRTLLHRYELLSEEIPRTMAIQSTLITTFGLAYNEYSGAFDQVVTLEELFR